MLWRALCSTLVRPPFTQSLGSHVIAERLIRHALQEGVVLTVVINKMDRLVLELKLPPSDAYYKIRNVLDSVNCSASPSTTNRFSHLSLSFSAIIEEYFQDPEVAENYRVSPELGNVLFASGEHGWSFSLTQFAHMYLEGRNIPHREAVRHTEFAKRLWGDKYFDADTLKFLNQSGRADQSRSFVEFILEPLYKIYAQVLSEEPKDLTPTLQEGGVLLSKEELALDVRPLLKVVLQKFFGAATGFVDVLVQHVPSPAAGARRKVTSQSLSLALISHSFFSG